SMYGRLVALLLAALVLGLRSSADALVLCAARDGSVKVREACKPRERRIDTAAMGLQGPPGSRGPQGERGLSGLAGTQGESGPQGPAGSTGERGVQGAPGPQGPQGERGPMGPQGPSGPQGAQGPQGPVGPEGAPGPALMFRDANGAPVGVVIALDGSASDSSSEVIRRIDTIPVRFHVRPD